MNFETWLVLGLAYFSILIAIISFHAKMRGRVLLLWALIGILTFSVFAYRHGAFGDLFGSIVEGPIYQGPKTADNVKQPTPPEIKTEKPNVWNEAKQELQQAIQER